MGYNGGMGPAPTSPIKGRAEWAAMVPTRVNEKKRYIITADDVVNIRIVLGMARTVQDVIDNG